MTKAYQMLVIVRS